MLKPGPAHANLATVTDERIMEPVFREELSKIWNRPVQFSRFFIPRVVPIGGQKFLVQYRFTTVDEQGLKNWIFFGRILAPEEMVPSYAQKPNAFFLPNLRLVVPVFPFDPKLKMLPKFFQPETSCALLHSLEPVLHGPLKIENVEVLGYRLELRSRSLLRVDLRKDSKIVPVIAKVMRPERALQLFANLQELERLGFAAGEEITIPHPIAYAPEGILWLEAVFDPALHDLIGKPGFAAGCIAAARTLTKLESAPLKNLIAYSLEEERVLLKLTTTEAAQIYPMLADRLKRLLTLLDKNAPETREGDRTPVHRDFYDKQLLIGANRTTLIDADTLALSDPALDVGNFLAHLFLRAKQNPAGRIEIEEGRRAFSNEYRGKNKSTADQKFWKRAGWWEAASLVRLACLYSLRPRWKHLTVPLLEQAEKILTEPGGMDA